jgi:hypothetical protein
MDGLIPLRLSIEYSNALQWLYKVLISLSFSSSKRLEFIATTRYSSMVVVRSSPTQRTRNEKGRYTDGMNNPVSNSGSNISKRTFSRASTHAELPKYFVNSKKELIP